MIGPRCILLAALPLLSLTIHAQASAQDLALAEALFRKGIADMEAGKFDSACPAIEESQRLDPRPGTLFTLADCQDKAGNIATASALYEDYLRAGAQMNASTKLRHAQRLKVATAQKAALAPHIPELTITLSAATPKGARVLLNGTELSEASLGVALPLDPGDHMVAARVGSGTVEERMVTLGKGEKRAVELEPKPAAQGPTAAPRAPFVPADDAALKARSAPGQGMSGRRIGALVAGGVGAAGLVLGGITGAIALSKKSAIDEGCVDHVCTREGKAAADSARTPGLLSSIGFGVGAAGLAAGAVLWLTEPSAARTGGAKPRVTAGVIDAGPGGATAGVKGVF
jgi:hypothetical protein